jgi:hypothetical protein
VVLEVKLFSEWLAKASFILLASGSVLLSFSFWQMKTGNWMITAGTITTGAVLSFCYNVLQSAKQTSKTTIEGKFIVASVLWLGFTATVGLALAVNLYKPYLPVSHLELLKLHAHAGGIGWFLLLIMGVGSKLIPMFLVSHHLDYRKLNFAFLALNTGLIAILAGFWFENYIVVSLAGVLIFSGLLSFLFFVKSVYKNRLKAHLDVGMQQTTLAFMMFAVTLISAVALIYTNFCGRVILDSLPLFYGCSIFPGFITALILGQTFKTLPFIVWLDTYRGRIGRGKIPMPMDLYFHKLVLVQMWVYGSGIMTLLLGVLFQNEWIIRAGALLLLFAALFYNINVFKIILHKPEVHV